MWTREDLKRTAKTSLKGYYWLAFVVCLLAGLIGAGNASAGSSYTSMNNMTESGGYTYDELLFILPIFVGILIIFYVIAIVYSTFLGNIIMIGKKHFFLSSREQTPQFTFLFANFRRGRYMGTVKTMFLTYLYIGLWTLLLIVPGIIKSYQYYMVSYIMAENPTISTKRALEISKHMTQGDKFNIFILELSFLGWYLLGLLACCVGGVFVNPYQEATLAELYALKRQEALDSGFVSASELCGFNN